MKFKLKYSIEVETELELPVLGYDLNKVSEQLTKNHIDYILERCIKDDREKQIFNFEEHTYIVHKKSKLISI